jgi:tetratricopeptide (TPR) repeat protein
MWMTYLWRAVVVLVGILAFDIGSRCNARTHDVDNTPDDASRYSQFMAMANKAALGNDLESCVSYILEALKIDSEDYFANQLLGTAYAKLSKHPQSIPYLNKSLVLSGWKDPLVGANYIEVLRASGMLTEATKVGWHLLELHPNTEAILYFNFGVVQEHLHNYELAEKLHLQSLALDPYYLSAWKNLFEIYIHDFRRYDKAEQLARQGLKYFPGDVYFYMALGLSLQHAAKLEEAGSAFQTVLSIDPNHYSAKTSLGAVYQVLGKAELATKMYESAMPFRLRDAAVRNNYGALLGVMGRREEEVFWLREALAIEPNMPHTLVNLGGHYQDEGLLHEAAQFLDQAIAMNYQPSVLRLRKDISLFPVSDSWHQMISNRIDARRRITYFIVEFSGKRNHTKDSLDASIDRIHFYIVYHGVNDRPFQELVARGYKLALSGINLLLPHLADADNSLEALWADISVREWTPASATVAALPISPLLSISLKRRVRVGFISKFFGIFEPHALLLDGIMTHLPRDRFVVYALPVARTDKKPLTPSIVDAADFVVEISLKHEHAFVQLNKLELDVLVFADTMGEPMNHFLAHSRLASIQVLAFVSTVFAEFYLSNRYRFGVTPSPQPRITWIISYLLI